MSLTPSKYDGAKELPSPRVECACGCEQVFPYYIRGVVYAEGEYFLNIDHYHQWKEERDGQQSDRSDEE